MLCIFEYVQIFSWKLNLLKEMRKCRKHAIVAAFNCSLLYSLHLFVVILLTDGGALAEILSQTIARKSVAAPQQTPPGYVVVSKSNDLPHGSSDHSGSMVGGSLLSFLDLIRQRDSGNQMPQCPCVTLPGSSECIVYEARFLAANVEEAILMFVDMSMDWRIFDERMGGPITPTTFHCNTEECRQCAGMLALRLRQIGLLTEAPNFPFTLPSEASLQLLACPRLRMSRAIPPAQVPPTPAFVEPVIAFGERLIPSFDAGGGGLSLFRRTIQQNILDSRAAGAQPLISRFIAKVTGGGATSSLANAAADALTNGVFGRFGQSGGGGSVGDKSASSTDGSTGGGSGALPATDFRPSGTSPHSPEMRLRRPSDHRPTVDLPFSVSPPRLVPESQRRRSEGRTSGETVARSSAEPGQQPRPQSQPQQQSQPPRSQPNSQSQLSPPSPPSAPLPRPAQPQPQRPPPSIQFRPQFPPSPQPPQLQPQFPTPFPRPVSSEAPPRWPIDRPGPVQRPLLQQMRNVARNNAAAAAQALSQQQGINWAQQARPQQFVQLQQQQTVWSQQPPRSWPAQSQAQPWSGVQQPQWGGVAQQWGNAIGNVNWPQAAATVGSAIDHAESGGWSGIGGHSVGGGAATMAGGGGGGDGSGNQWGGGGQWTGSLGGRFGKKKQRKREVDERILGDRFILHCVERGEPDNEESDYLNLCTICWAWRKLPDGFFPRIINELLCNEDDYCLSGWGTCLQRYRSVDVLRKSALGPNGWRPVTISTATSCDCRVRAGSQLHSLVAGRNT